MLYVRRSPLDNSWVNTFIDVLTGFSLILVDSIVSTTGNDLQTTVQEVSSSPIISHPVVSVASGCTTSAWPRASNTRVDMTDSPASPDATDVQPVVSRTSLNQMGTSSIVTLSSSGRHGHFVVSTASNEALKSCVNLPPRQEAVATAVAVKCSQSTCYVPPCHSGEVAKPEPRESSAKIGQCNNGEIAKTTVICKTLRLAMEFDSTESNIAVNLAKLQPTTATVATAFTQASTLLKLHSCVHCLVSTLLRVLQSVAFLIYKEHCCQPVCFKLLYLFVIMQLPEIN